MTAFSQTHYVDYILCKCAIYFHRVARGASIGATSLLSVFQAITIRPNNSKWAQLKVRAPRIIGPSLSLCWALKLFVNVFIPLYASDIWGRRNVTRIKDYVYCASVNSDRLIDKLTEILLATYDIIILVLMMWDSGYMVFILLKHTQRVQQSKNVCTLCHHL